MALRRKNLAEEILGVCRHRSSLVWAKKLGAITKGYSDIKDAVRDSDLIILATPVNEIIEIIPRIYPFIKKGAIVTDVGSTKVEIVKQGERVFSKDIYFVGAHPLTGSEKRGIKEAKENIFRNNFCIITSTPHTNKMALEKVCSLWKLLGAKIKVMTPSVHDCLMAKISHLPHAVAVALILSIEDKNIPLGAGGLRDTTRIASSSPYLWRDIFFTNQKLVLKTIEKFNRVLNDFSSALYLRDKSALFNLLKRAQKKRALLKG
ncbi:MAG: prephenate dehydrogenase [Candidatus Omnitrophica bacterium]|nr:prephenate dehydrogenase [Candidatus Omnitrophota bacterium]